MISDRSWIFHVSSGAGLDSQALVALVYCSQPSARRRRIALAITLWRINLFSLFSCFGALIVAAFIAGLIAPTTLFIINRDILVRYIELLAVLKLLLQVALIEYPIVMIFILRDRLPNAVRRVLVIYALMMGLTVVPMMMVEDLLVLRSIIPAYNLAEATGFLSMTTAIMIFGIHHISGRKHIEPVPLLDVSRRYGLTGRETEVMKELVAGARYKEIGQKLNISPETVKTHVSRVSSSQSGEKGPLLANN